MLNIKLDKEVQPLKNCFTRSGNEFKTIASFMLAKVLVEKRFSINESTEAKEDISKVLFRLNEYVIMDRKLVETHVKNIIEFKEVSANRSKESLKVCMVATSFKSLMHLDVYFPDNLMETIDNHPEFTKVCLTASMNAIDAFTEKDESWTL